MSTPSEPLLKWLRDLLQQRGINSAELARMVGLPRAQVRRVLGGSEPMTVDMLLDITQKLELSPSDLGLPEPVEGAQPEAGEEETSEPGAPGLALTEAPSAAEPVAEAPRVDPWGNQPRQLVEIGFALGCDFGFVVDSSQLGDSGIPRHILDPYQGGPMRIQLDAAYHRYNEPRYDDASVTLTLSFDALYDCTFPWTAFQQVVFAPATPEPKGHEDTGPEEPGPPRLRLVT